MMMLCATLSLSACQWRVTEQDGPLFRDVQRAPPPVAPETVDFLVREERGLAVWIAETNKNCSSFGCLK